MRERYLQKLLIYLGQRFNTIPFVLLACIILPEIIVFIVKFLFVLEYNKVKSLCYTIFWQTITQRIFTCKQAEDTLLKISEACFEPSGIPAMELFWKNS